MGLLLHLQMISFYFHFLLSLHGCSEASEVAAVKCQNTQQSPSEAVFAICRPIGLFEKMATSRLQGFRHAGSTEEHLLNALAYAQRWGEIFDL